MYAFSARLVRELDPHKVFNFPITLGGGFFYVLYCSIHDGAVDFLYFYPPDQRYVICGYFSMYSLHLYSSGPVFFLNLQICTSCMSRLWCNYIQIPVLVAQNASTCLREHNWLPAKSSLYATLLHLPSGLTFEQANEGSIQSSRTATNNNKTPNAEYSLYLRFPKLTRTIDSSACVVAKMITALALKKSLSKRNRAAGCVFGLIRQEPRRAANRRRRRIAGECRSRGARCDHFFFFPGRPVHTHRDTHTREGLRAYARMKTRGR